MPCSRCGQSGHNIRTCSGGGGGRSSSGGGSRSRSYGGSYSAPRRVIHCSNCGGAGHNIRGCSARGGGRYVAPAPRYVAPKVRTVHCSNCGGAGHNKRTCGAPGGGGYVPQKPKAPKTRNNNNNNNSLKKPAPKVRTVHCSNCGGAGHNKRTCGAPAEYVARNNKKPVRKCGYCRKPGHNRRTCKELALANGRSGPTATPNTPSKKSVSDNKVSGLKYTKDGKLDKRYEVNRKYLQQQRLNSIGSEIPDHIKRTKSGKPDMRTTAAKEWVKAQAAKMQSEEEFPEFMKRTKKGNFDQSDELTSDFLENANVEYEEHDTDDYLQNKMQFGGGDNNMDVDEDADRCRQAFIDALKEVVEIFQPDEIQPPEELQKNDKQQEDNEQEVVTLPEEEPEWWDEIEETAVHIADGDAELVKIKDGELGKGAFGVVYKSTYKDQTVAMKELHLPSLNKKEKKSFIKEVNVLAKLGKHDNLITLHGYRIKPPAIVMEYVELGNLQYLLHECDDEKIEANMYDVRIKKKIAFGIACGLKQMHLFEMVHGDIKSANGKSILLFYNTPLVLFFLNVITPSNIIFHIP